MIYSTNPKLVREARIVKEQVPTERELSKLKLITVVYLDPRLKAA